MSLGLDFGGGGGGNAPPLLNVGGQLPPLPPPVPPPMSMAIRMSMRQWAEVAVIILQYWELAVLMALNCLHLLSTKGRICGVGGCKVDQLAVCILFRTVDRWKKLILYSGSKDVSLCD